ncbi:MAG: sigma-70 family RNA polymerase sigma factor [Oscillospiraceae bacterium]|nr:sigma-70 family RNA polymerase sigma factor [Oscillospiraceae bacterium]
MQELEVLSLYDLHSNMVYRIALSYLRQVQDAEDAVQVVFLKMIEGRAVPEPGKERAFITRITVNYCKDVLRSVWKNRVQPLSDEIVFEEKEDRELFDVIMGLATKYRVVIYMHFYEGYTFSEIADFMKINTSAVSMRIHRAKKLLKNILGEDNNAIQLQTNI